MANNNISTYLTKIMGIFEANLALFGSLVEISLKFKFLPRRLRVGGPSSGNLQLKSSWNSGNHVIVYTRNLERPKFFSSSLGFTFGRNVRHFAILYRVSSVLRHTQLAERWNNSMHISLKWLDSSKYILVKDSSANLGVISKIVQIRPSVKAVSTKI